MKGPTLKYQMYENSLLAKVHIDEFVTSYNSPTNCLRSSNLQFGRFVYCMCFLITRELGSL